MDRPTTSTNPLFIEQEEDPNNYVTKNHLFGAQRALHQENEALNDHIDLLTTDLRQSELHTRDYLDHKLSTQMEEIDERLSTQKAENDARMEEIHALLFNRSSTS
jgi:hypothetical protein